MDLDLSEENQRILLTLARETIAYGCSSGVLPDMDTTDYPENLCQPVATFVTLQKQGELRGCIGSLVPQRALIEDVTINAFASAFRDHRFNPVTLNELPSIQIEISMLSPMHLLEVSSEEELLRVLRPNVDGLLIRGDHHSATFLPQVWEQLPKPSDFIIHLKHKARLRKDEWPSDLRCFRYHCIKFCE
jgi:AmmeMemoRadiSam system protein A